MKKIFLTIQFAALMAGLPAFALVGGPFDNGEYSILLERNGFYEAAYSFKNGSGYSQWTADNRQGDIAAGGTVTQNLGAGSLINTASSGNNGNRTVLYYKGVTYFGSAFGEVDTNARTIMGFCNASSDYSTSATTTTQQAGFFTTATSSAFSSSTVVSNGRNYTANVNWTGKITDTATQLRFSGSGELFIISPNGSEAIAGLAYSSYASLLTAISANVSQGLQSLSLSGGATYDPFNQAAAAMANVLSGSAGVAAIPASQTVTPINFTQARDAAGAAVDVNGNGIFNDDLVATSQNVTNQAAIAAIPPVPGLVDYLQGTGPDSSYEEGEKVKIKVTGYRRFF